MTWDDEATKIMLRWRLMLWYAEIYENIDFRQIHAYQNSSAPRRDHLLWLKPGVWIHKITFRLRWLRLLHNLGLGAVYEEAHLRTGLRVDAGAVIRLGTKMD